MKNFLLSVLFAVLILIICPQNQAFADIMEGLVTSGKVVYTPQTQAWSRSSTDNDKIILTRKSQNSTPKTVYYLENGDKAFSTNADYEFVYKGKLLLYYCEDLKFNEITVVNGNFNETMVSINDLEKLFPNTYILPLSKFQNDIYVLKRTPYAREKALIVNDMNRTFKDYIFSPYPVQKSPIRGLFAVTRVGMVKYMKKGDVQQKYPVLKIKLRNDPDKYYKGPDMYTRVYGSR